MNPISLSRQSEDTLLERMLRGVHETYAQACAASLSAFLQTEVGLALETVGFQNAADFRGAIETPSAVIGFELQPAGQRTILVLNCPAVFGLLELLLGGDPSAQPSGAGSVQQRNFTEIEWALLEEVVRVLVAPLGQVWKAYHAVEFKVLALENDPQLLPLPEPAQSMVRLQFSLTFAGQTGSMRIAVPRRFFEPTSGNEEPEDNRQHGETFQRNLEILGEAQVEVRVMLEGPAMQLGELAALEAGQVVRFDYPLQKPLRAVVNDVIPISGQIVNAGRKRAFQVEALP